MGKINKQSGAVSLFAVIFATLLLTILTISFIKIMINEQQRATENDLSQSAYDAALAGVEDAKRAIRRCQQGDATACNALAAADDCKVVARAGVAGNTASNETVIQSNSTSGQAYDQAYSCVNIDMNTEDFLYDAQEAETELIPLRATGSVSRLVLEWYSQKDVGEGLQATDPPAVVSGAYLPPKADWGATVPPVLRVQVITPGEQFNLGDLDDSDASQTVFLRPTGVSGGPNGFLVSLAAYSRATDGTQHDNSVTPIPSCTRTFNYDGYACKAILELPSAMSAADSRNSFVSIKPIYKGAAVRLQMQAADGSVVMLNGVQPAVDSTGRASNLYRRVDARLKIGDDFPYPENALSVENSLCKDFSVTNSGVVNGVCTP
ncbi:hypothetical protein CR969_02245 [Candidatus Saccharibacteria bacterium]|nr:MAG: hypothetical protein CR969_02245 [Candidatus Saccharibacteria bacterium]